MVLAGYPTRNFPETRYVEDTTQRTYNADTTWASSTNSTINPGSDTLLHIRVKSNINTYTSTGVYTFVWKWRIKDGTTVVWTSPVHSWTSPAGTYQISPTETDAFYYVATAGSHTIYLEYALYRGGSSGTQRLEETDWRIGSIGLKNLTYDTKTFSSVSCSNGAYTTLLSASSLTIPASSSLFYGSIKAFNVVCAAYIIPDTAYAVTWQDAGDKYTSGLNYYVEFGSTPWDWSVENNESTYGVDMKGATAITGYSASPSEALTLTLKVYNSTGTTRTISGNVLVFISPWMVTYNSHAPWALPELPMGSTVYFTLDPEGFQSDTVVYAGARKKIVNFGTGVTASDYMGIDSETSGVQTLGYAFDKATPSDIDVMARAKCGFINRIMIDFA